MLSYAHVNDIDIALQQEALIAVIHYMSFSVRRNTNRPLTDNIGHCASNGTTSHTNAIAVLVASCSPGVIRPRAPWTGERSLVVARALLTRANSL